jgi:hypothetical protein
MLSLKKQYAVLLGVPAICLMTYWYYRQIDNQEKPIAEQKRKWAISKVEHSGTGSAEHLLRVARDSGHAYSLYTCRWEAKSFWGKSDRNPNFFSRLDGVTAYRVDCWAFSEPDGADFDFWWMVSYPEGRIYSFEWSVLGG